MAKLENVKTLDMVNGEITRVEYNGETYSKVSGSAEVDDLVIVVKPWSTVEKGGYYFVEKLSSGHGHDYVHVGDGIVGYQEDFEAYRKGISGFSHQYRKVTDRKPKAGDFVKFTKTDDDNLTIGKYYEILGIDSVGDPRIINDAGEDSYALYDEEEFEVYEQVAKQVAPCCEKPEPKLKVGDYAKVIQTGHCNEGEIVEILSVDYSEYYPFDTKLINGKNGDCHRPDQLVRATNEEVAEAKAKLAEAKEAEQLERRWASINRKPNEFKKGDIVLIKRGLGGLYKEGEIRIINEVAPSGYGDAERGLTLVGNGWIYKHNVELVTPVEARFDR